MENKAYKTKDLWEAAALLTNDIPLVDIKREGKICFFIFGDIDNAQKLSKSYFYGNMKINVFRYKEAIERLKSQIFK